MQQHCQKFLLIGLFTFVGFGGFKPTWSSPKLIYIIHSYENTFEYTNAVDRGIASELNEISKWKLKQFYLNGKTHGSPREIAARAEPIKKEILEQKPAALILTDDPAFKAFYPFAKTQKIPVSFSGINGRLQDYGYTVGDKLISGTLESYNIAGAVRIARQLRPSLKNILIVSEPDITGKALLNSFLVELNDMPETKSELGVSTYVTGLADEMKARLAKVDPSSTLVMMAGYYTQRDGAGKYVSRQEMSQWIIDNTSFLDIGHIAIQFPAGRLLGLAFSAEEMGSYAAKILKDSFDYKKDLSLIPIRKHLPLHLVMNFERAKKLKLEIPFEILSYVENNREMIGANEKPLKK